MYADIVSYRMVMANMAVSMRDGSWPPSRYAAVRCSKCFRDSSTSPDVANAVPGGHNMAEMRARAYVKAA